MSKNSSLLLLATFAVGLSSLNFNRCQAQAASTGPSGDFHVTVSNPESVVWDLEAIGGLKTMDFGIEGSGGQDVVALSYADDFQQNGSGKLTGAGITTVQLSYEASNDSWVTAPDFQATYKVTGSISSTPGKARGSFTTAITGTGMFEGQNRRLAATRKIDFVVDNQAKTVTGTEKRTASAAGKGSATNTEKFGPDSTVLPSDGSWDLNMTLSMAANLKTVTGTAVATLHSGQTYPFAVKGTYNPKTQQSKLVLTGKDIAKGSSLQVTMTASTVTLIKGKVSGQFVSTQF